MEHYKEELKNNGYLENYVFEVEDMKNTILCKFKDISKYNISNFEKIFNNKYNISDNEKGRKFRISKPHVKPKKYILITKNRQPSIGNSYCIETKTFYYLFEIKDKGINFIQISTDVEFFKNFLEKLGIELEYKL